MALPLLEGFQALHFLIKHLSFLDEAIQKVKYILTQSLHTMQNKMRSLPILPLSAFLPLPFPPLPLLAINLNLQHTLQHPLNLLHSAQLPRIQMPAVTKHSSQYIFNTVLTADDDRLVVEQRTQEF